MWPLKKPVTVSGPLPREDKLPVMTTTFCGIHIRRKTKKVLGSRGITLKLFILCFLLPSPLCLSPTLFCHLTTRASVSLFPVSNFLGYKVYKFYRKRKKESCSVVWTVCRARVNLVAKFRRDCASLHLWKSQRREILKYSLTPARSFRVHNLSASWQLLVCIHYSWMASRFKRTDPRQCINATTFSSPLPGAVVCSGLGRRLGAEGGRLLRRVRQKQREASSRRRRPLGVLGAGRSGRKTGRRTRGGQVGEAEGVLRRSPFCDLCSGQRYWSPAADGSSGPRWGRSFTRRIVTMLLSFLVFSYLCPFHIPSYLSEHIHSLQQPAPGCHTLTPHSLLLTDIDTAIPDTYTVTHSKQHLQRMYKW